MFNRNGDLEQKPAKTDDADAKSPGRHDFDLDRTFKQVGDAVGKAQNDMIERLTNVHIKQQYVASISPALANQYVSGRDIALSRSQAGKSITDLSDLSAAERKAVQTYQRLHSDLPSKIPFYNKETLANDLDRDIVRKARSQPVVKTDAAEAKPSSRPAKPEVRPEVRPEVKPQGRAEAAAKPNLKPDSNAEPKPVSKPGSRSDSKTEHHTEFRAQAHTELKIDSKPSAKSDLKTDSKINAGADSRPQAITPEKVLPSAATVSKEQIPIKKQPDPLNGIVGAAVPGNALLTSLSKNKDQNENRFLSQQLTQSTASAKGEHDQKVAKNPPPAVAYRDIKPDNRPEFKAELRPAPIQTTRPDKQEVESTCKDEKKVLISSSTSDHPKAPNVRLIQVSQSNIAAAYRDGAINVVRQLSDRTACSSIRVIVKPTAQSNAKQEIKLDEMTTLKQGERNQPSKLPNFNAGANAGTIADFKANSTAENSSPNLNSKAVPKPVIRDEPRATFNIDPKPVSISDSLPGKPSISPKTADPGLVNRADKEVPLEAFVDSQGNVLRGYRLKCQDSDLKYITGPEIALSAIIALAGIAKLRTDQSMWQPDSTALVQNYGEQIYDTGKTFDSIHNSNSNSTLSAKGEKGDSATSGTLDAAEHSTESRKDESEASTRVFIRPKILIGANDSLVSIAEQLFNDSGIAWLILKLNADLRPMQIEGKTIVRLRSRQEILVPVYQDIIDFQKSRTKEMSGQNLITIVEENQIDREIIDQAIAPMLGQNSSNVDPLQFSQSLQSLQPLEIVVAEDE